MAKIIGDQVDISKLVRAHYLYDEDTAAQVYQALPSICVAMKKTIDQIKTF